MADNKAEEAVKEADTNLKIKVYYSGKVPSECGVIELGHNEPLDKDHKPWLFKCYFSDNPHSCIQFVDSLEVYQRLSRGLSNILDAVIVNAKQREALDKIVDHLLWGELASDNSHENDYIGEMCYN